MSDDVTDEPVRKPWSIFTNRRLFQGLGEADRLETDEEVLERLEAMGARLDKMDRERSLRGG